MWKWVIVLSFLCYLVAGFCGCSVSSEICRNSTSSQLAASCVFIPGAVEPTDTYQIHEPGLYALAGIRHCQGTGIEVHAHNVTIDLQGYSLIGPGKDSGENYGIKTNNYQNLTVRDGTIRDFGDRGIVDRGEKQPSGYKEITNVKFLKNGKCGICVGGPGNLIQDCTCSENGASGICPGFRSRVIGNLCHMNASNGIHSGRGCIIKDNVLTENGRSGLEAYCGSLITDNCFYMNNRLEDPNHAGIRTLHGCQILNNVMRDNQVQNVLIFGEGNRITDNTITGTRSPAVGIMFKMADNDWKNNTLVGNTQDYHLP